MTCRCESNQLGKGRCRPGLTVSLAVLALWGTMRVAGARPPETLIIRNHRFEPEQLTVPIGEKIELHVRNADATPEEFESTDLRRERVVPAGEEIVVYVGPLRPGSYEFFGDFNPATARGHLVAQ